MSLDTLKCMEKNKHRQYGSVLTIITRLSEYHTLRAEGLQQTAQIASKETEIETNRKKEIKLNLK